MSKKITKAIIPVAGLGTRFLPFTKSIPKEMLPILNKPTIQYIVEEAVASGITDILLITSGDKNPIIDYFDRNLLLESFLRNKGKDEKREEVKELSSLARIFSIRQSSPKGLGHAIGLAREFVNGEPFVVLLGDNVVDSEVPAIKQLIDKWLELPEGSSLIGAEEVAREKVSSYGVIDFLSSNEDGVMKVRGMVEKPSIEDAPSNLIISGRYILSSHVFEHLDKNNVDKATNEIQLTDSIEKLIETKGVYAYKFEGKNYDLGSEVGFVKANIDFARKKPSLRSSINELLKLEIEESDN